MLNRGEQTLRAVTGSGGRLHFGMVAGIKSERWPTSNRNPRPDCLGIRTEIALSGKAVRNPADSKPIAATRPTRRKGARPHFRGVDLAGAPEVFQALKSEAEEHSACAAWVFMIVTAARPSEALSACWAEIDLDRKLWTVPAARMKSAREHIVAAVRRGARGP